MQRIAINGFGRIGRNVLRAWFESPKQFHFEIVAINDIADVQTLVHLFKYDSTHGRFHGKVDVVIENEKIYLNIRSNQRNLKVEVLKQKQPNCCHGLVYTLMLYLNVLACSVRMPMQPVI